MDIVQEYQEEVEHLERKMNLVIKHIETYGYNQQLRDKVNNYSYKIQRRRMRIRELKSKHKQETGLQERSSQNLKL